MPIPIDQLIQWISQNKQTEIREAVSSDHTLLRLRAKDGSSLLRQALYRQRADVARVLIDAGAEPDFYDACALGDRAAAARFLANDKALASSFSEDGFPALGLAIFFGNRDIAIDLLLAGAPVTDGSRNQLRVTPLHSAVAAGDIVMTAVLLSHGADPNAKEGSGGTPLHTAAGVGNLEITQMLLRHGASCSARTDSGETPLDFARKYQREETAAWLSGQPGCK